MGIKQRFAPLAFLILLSSILLIPQISMDAKGGPYGLELPYEFNLKSIDADYDIKKDRYSTHIGERVQVDFLIDVTETDVNLTYRIHFIAMLSGYKKPTYRFHYEDPFRPGKDLMDTHKKIKDSYEVDLEYLDFDEIVSKNMTKVSVNYTFKTTGDWTLYVITEIEDGLYLDEDFVKLKVRNETQETVFIAGILISIIFLAIAVYLAVFKRRMKVWRSLTPEERKIPRKVKFKAAGLISIFIVVMLIMTAVYNYYNREEIFVHRISEMDGEYDGNDTIHIAWIESISRSWSEDLDNFNRRHGFFSEPGQVFYSRYSISTGVLETILVSYQAKALNVQLLLDSEGQPHIFWTTKDRTLRHVEVDNDWGIGSARTISWDHDEHFRVAVDGNDTFYITGARDEPIILYPDGSTSTNMTYRGYDIYIDDLDDVYIIKGSNYSNGTTYINYSKISNGIETYNNDTLPLLTGRGCTRFPYAYRIFVDNESRIYFITPIELFSDKYGDQCHMSYARSDGNYTKNMTLPFNVISHSRNSHLKIQYFNGTIYAASSFSSYEGARFFVFIIEDDGDWVAKKMDSDVRFFFRSKDGNIYGVSKESKYVKMEKQIDKTITLLPITWD